MRLTSMIAIAVLAALAPAAHADECDNAATQMAINACAARNFQTEDARLNATYNEVVNRLHGLDDARKQLLASERAWVLFRDAECTFATNQLNGGSAQPMAVSSCRAAMTKERTRQLRGYLECKEGDLSCPLPPR